ncbi:flavin reductase family protein [Cryobacterium sp. PH29-G1]|uniref:flavin reductase family protein n=1 Tax=Cryobacterium sp. PH29-G1 TaxID=3046211 RepID=UPI0024BB2E61|nr:flavin reductase family protein [Cryobacterium sp. PH29-G1]MDJ0347934.1 flavin reductase family protein [Cryobacterium sp. PH29-G1]
MASHTDLHRLELSPGSGPEIRQRFIAGMGKATAAVTLVTTDGTAGRFGQTVTAMMSVSADPPTLVIGLFRGAPVADAVRTNQCFAVNILSTEDMSVAQNFAGVTDPSTRYKFGPEWKSLRTGSPILPTAAASFDCHAEQFLVAGSHLLIVGRVVDAQASEAATLIYGARSYGFSSPLPFPL